MYIAAPKHHYHRIVAQLIPRKRWQQQGEIIQKPSMSGLMPVYSAYQPISPPPSTSRCTAPQYSGLNQILWKSTVSTYSNCFSSYAIHKMYGDTSVRLVNRRCETSLLSMLRPKQPFLSLSICQKYIYLEDAFRPTIVQFLCASIVLLTL